MSSIGHTSESRVSRSQDAAPESASRDVIFLIEPEQEKVVGVTSGIQKWIGYETVDIVGRKFSSLYAPPDVSARGEGKTTPNWDLGETLRLSFYCSDNTQRAFDVTLSSMHANDHRHMKMAVLHEPGEATAPPEAEPQVRQMIETQALRTLLHETRKESVESQFLSKVSHQVRTPLGVILSSAGILGRYDHTFNTEQRQEYIQAIADSVQRITGLLEDVVWLSKLQTGSIEFKPKSENLLHLCHGVIEEARAAAGKTVTISFLHTDIPQQVVCDESLIRMILLHLLSNAIKFTHNNQSIQLRLKREGANCTISVVDGGVGIESSDHGLIFRPFFRGSNVGDIPGNGLGLSIVKHCVSLHGGSIIFDSQTRTGATFHVTIPLFNQPKGAP